ncbi:MAG: response regulator transcription factor [Candidatus Adiutrix sp.]|jgi:DNA-binding response OmpR family regulator|nr:response regulator transcription factor [Candidatus Adiutrix sp.]
MNGKVLIIDDDPYISKIQRTYLEKAGFEVSTALDGESGYALALGEQPKMVILDLNLPGATGFEICRRMREKLDMPIIIVTSRTDEALKIKGLELGAVDYVTKPFSTPELVARVKAQLAQGDRLARSINPESRSERKFGRIRIMLDNRELYIGGRKIKLPLKEYELLCHLSANPNLDFSTEQLYEAVWGNDRQGDLKTVAVHIKRLRDKVEGDPSKPRYIQTIQGRVYRFVPD